MTIKITVNSKKQNINVSSAPKNSVKISTRMGAGGASAIDTIAELRDVDASDADNNETLVFDSTTQKYVVKPLPAIDGGTY